MFSNLVSHNVYHGVEPIMRGHAYDYILAGNGLFKRAESYLIRGTESRLIKATLPLHYGKVAGLPPLRPELSVYPDRIPGGLLNAICRDARQAAVERHEKVYLIRVVETPQGHTWRVTVPGQAMGRASVHYDTIPDTDVICELHSHHTMGAFFSQVDDIDEQGFHFYAVIGRLLDSRPQMALRLGMYGDRWPLPVNLLFTDSGPFRDVMDAERDDGD